MNLSSPYQRVTRLSSLAEAIDACAGVPHTMLLVSTLALPKPDGQNSTTAARLRGLRLGIVLLAPAVPAAAEPVRDRHDEHRDRTTTAAVLAGTRRNDQHGHDGTVGHPHLLAIDDVVAAVAPGEPLEAGRTVVVYVDAIADDIPRG